MVEIDCNKGETYKVPSHQVADARRVLPGVCARFCTNGRCGFKTGDVKFIKAFMAALDSSKDPDR